jgi:hypothetical protein
MSFIETLLLDIQAALYTIGPILSVILIILGGIVYGLAQTQPAENRGKWQNAAVGMVIGGVVIAAIIGGATLIRETSSKLLT